MIPIFSQLPRHPSFAKEGNSLEANYSALVQKIPLFEPGRHVFLGYVTDVLADERFDFEFEPVLEHQIELLLPRLLMSEPWILSDLASSFDVLLVQFDLHTGTKLAALVIAAAQAEESGIRNGHAARFVRQVDRSLFDNAIDVVSPWIVIQEAIDR